MNLGTVGWLTLLCPFNLSHLLKLIKRLKQKLIPELDLFSCLGLSIRCIFKRVLVLLRLYGEVLILLLLRHKKRLRQLWVLLLENVFLFRWKACHVVGDAELTTAFHFVVLLLLDFNFLLLDRLGLLFDSLLKELGFLLATGDLVDFSCSGSDEFGEHCFHWFFCL